MYIERERDVCPSVCPGVGDAEGDARHAGDPGLRTIITTITIISLVVVVVEVSLL